MIREMELADVPRVAEIHVFGWRNAYKGIVSDDHLFNKMLVTNRMEYFMDTVRNNLTESYVYDDGIIKAILTIGSCRDEDKKNSFELWGIYVESFMQKQGIGSKMTMFCEEKAAERGFKEICLWVLEQNENARAFYEKQGYLPEGTSKFIDYLGVTEMRYHKYL